MSEVLEDYLVSVGIKGQDVVLAETAKIKKSVNEIKQSSSASTKTATVDFSKNAKSFRENFANIRKEINARKQLNQIKRQSSLMSGRRELESIRSKEAAAKASQTEKVVGGIQGAGQRASGAFQGAMMGSLITQLPGLGSLFSAANSSIESAGQEFVAGIAAQRNIRLITKNFTKNFGSAFDQSFSGGMFATRETKAMFNDLAEQGVKTSTLTSGKNQNLLDEFARAQGVGSIQELFQRAQSGQLKEGAGFGKSDIMMAQSAAGLMGNRYTADLGMQMFLRTIERRRGAVGQVAGSGPMTDLATSVHDAGRIGEREESYQAEAAGLFAGSENPMYRSRASERRLRARMQGAARRVSNTGRNIQGRVMRLGENIAEHGVIEGYRRTVEQAQQDYREGRGLTSDEDPTDSSNQRERQRTQPRMQRGAENPDLRSSLNPNVDDVSRASSALASEINNLTNQINAMRNRFSTVG